MKTKTILFFLLSILFVFNFSGCNREEKKEQETSIEENTIAEIEEFSEDYFEFDFPTNSIKSQIAKDIIKQYDLSENSYILESKDATGEKTIVLNVYTGQGIDADGLYYSFFAQPEGNCFFCDKILGIGENMCDGNCYISFNSIPSGSIVHPEDKILGPLY